MEEGIDLLVQVDDFNVSPQAGKFFMKKDERPNPRTANGMNLFKIENHSLDIGFTYLEEGLSQHFGTGDIDSSTQ